ncbi:MAG: SAM-dependent chlorinase/fluorinase [Candidatus Schekmanbacteria bacterium]|nr:SAM-dependent chlorinase/fluorinase [Candidatus Schekmanbacteria bacterium]
MEKFKHKLKSPVISLLTDFGTRDYFVGTMKGVILSIYPEAKIVDITHEVSPFNIMEAAFILKNSYNYFPEGTVHLVVVDPGVGSERGIVIVKSRKYTFVAPDNGVLTYIYFTEEEFSIYRLNEKKILSEQPASRTFHGRDIMAPIAARLAKGETPEEFGDPIDRFKVFNFYPSSFQKGTINGAIIYIDKFGNLISNISEDFFDRMCTRTGRKKIKIKCGDHEVSDTVPSYSKGKKNAISAIWASHGNLEIFVREGNASKKLKIKTGDKVTISFIRN